MKGQIHLKPLMKSLETGKIALYIIAAAAAKSLQSCLTLCDPIDGSPPGSSNACMHAKLLQSCPTLCNPLDSSPPGSSVHGIL